MSSATIEGRSLGLNASIPGANLAQAVFNTARTLGYVPSAYFGRGIEPHYSLKFDLEKLTPRQRKATVHLDVHIPAWDYLENFDSAADPVP